MGTRVGFVATVLLACVAFSVCGEGERGPAFGRNPLGAPGPFPPTQADPQGFAGDWVEYWGQDQDHETGIITFQNGQYTVQMISSRGTPWRVTDSRLEGNTLKFTQHLVEQGVDRPIQYELAVQDANTLRARVATTAKVPDSILWRRQGGNLPQFSMAPPVQLPGGTGGDHSRPDTEYTRLTAEQITSALRGMGLQAELRPAPGAPPLWAIELDNWKASVLAYDDNRKGDGSYNSLQIRASFRSPQIPKADLIDRANQWNLAMRDMRAYIAGDGSCVLAMDTDITGGVSIDVIREAVRVFRAQLPQFVDRVCR